MTLSKIWNRLRWPRQGERLQAGILYGVVTLLVSAALLLSGLRLAVALAPSLLTTVEARLSAVLDVPVRMGGFDARLEGLRPTLVLKSVAIGADDEPSLSLDALNVAIAPWRSLQAGALRLHALSASGLDVDVERTAAGQWRTSAVMAPIAPSASDGLVQSLRTLPVDRLLIRDATLRVHDVASGGRWQFSPVALRWQREDSGEWRFAVDARDGEQRLRGRFQLDANQIDQARGYINVADWHAQSLTPLLAQALPTLAAPGSAGRIDGEVWMQLGAGGIETLSAEIRAEQLDDFAGLNGFGASVWLARNDQGWRGVVEPSTLVDRNGNQHAVGRIGVGRDGPGDRPWRARLEDLPVALVAEVMSGAVPAIDQARGRVERFDAVWQNPVDWQARAQLREVSLPASASLPAMNGPSGRLALGPRGGSLRLEDWRADIAAPDVLRRPIALSAINTTLTWWRGAEGELRMGAPSGRARWLDSVVEFSGRYWQRPGEADWVDIQAGYGGASSAAVLAHLPVGIMHPNLPGWLDRAIDGGELSAASLRLFGPLADFPFDQGQGLFDLRTRIRGVDFQFNPRWGGFSDADAQLRFRNRAMDIAVARAEIGGVSVTDAHARIEDLWSPQLRVDGRFQGALTSMQSYLQATPLPAADGLNALSLEGSGVLDLEMFFPFRQRPVEVSGSLLVDGAELALATIDQPFKALRGVLDFTQDGLSAQGLRADFAGAPVVAQVSTQGEGAEARIRVDATATLDVTTLPSLAALAPYASGPAQWRAVWERPGWTASADQPSARSALTLRSDLTGTELRLPFGLSKPASTALQTRIEWQGGPAQAQDVHLALGDRLQAHGRWSTAGTGQLGVHFGADSAALPEQPVTHVTGSLPVVALDNLSGQDGIGSADWLNQMPALALVDVELAGIDVARWQIPATSVRAEKVSGAWALRLEGNAAGSGQWQSSPRPSLELDLSRLVVDRRPDLPAPTEPAEKAVAPAAEAGQRPELRVNADTLVAAGATLGELAFSLTGDGSPSEQARVSIQGEQLDLNVLAQPSDEAANRKQLRFDLFTDDAGAVLRGLGLPRAMRNGVGEVSGELDWTGPLLSPERSSLDGEVNIDLRKGALLAIEPGPGRALGLFSLSVLPRRIGLDFSDVVGEGLTFDSLKGSWAVADGIMQTDNLTLTGPSLNLDVVGETDLVRRRYDQAVTVTPRLSSALTFLGGLAGGPVAAVVLFFSRDVIEPGVERLTELEYRIVGPWADPRFELLTPTTAANGTSEGGDD
jgi:uncharacterized protein (TIGR02099 family)